MRIITVAPGPVVSTYNTWEYYTAAFRQNGHTVFEFRYHDLYSYHCAALCTMYGDPERENDPVTQRKAMTAASENLIARVARLVPDVVFIVSGLALPLAVWDWLDEFRKNLNKPFKTALFLTESPYIDENQLVIAERADYVMTTDINSVERIRACNENTTYIRHAFNPVVHRATPVSSEFAHDVFMVGTGFPERVALLSSVDWRGIDFGLYGDYWDTFDGGEALVPFYTKRYLDNEKEVPWYYSNSRISLNIYRTARHMISGNAVEHIEGDEAYSISPRCYEIMGCGGFLLTDARPELYDLFNVGSDLVVYDGANDLGDKVRYYLSHDGERSRIARNGWYAVREHTYANRAMEIVDFVAQQGSGQKGV